MDFCFNKLSRSCPSVPVRRAVLEFLLLRPRTFPDIFGSGGVEASGPGLPSSRGGLLPTPNHPRLSPSPSLRLLLLPNYAVQATGFWAPSSRGLGFPGLPDVQAGELLTSINVCASRVTTTQAGRRLRARAPGARGLAGAALRAHGAPGRGRYRAHGALARSSLRAVPSESRPGYDESVLPPPSHSPRPN